MSGAALSPSDRLRAAGAAWRRLPALRRMKLIVGLLAALAIPLGFVDTSLGVGIAAVAALYGLSKLPQRPKLVAQVALIVAFAYPEPSLAAILAVFFGVFHLPAHLRRFALPGVALAAAMKSGKIRRLKKLFLVRLFPVLFVFCFIFSFCTSHPRYLTARQ